MPPVRRPRPAYPQTARCRYVDDDGVRCRRIATVDGELCRHCAAALELDIERGSGTDRLLGTLDRALSRGARDPFLSQMGAMLGGMLGATLIRRAPPAIQDPLRQAGRMAAAAARARAANVPPPPPRQPPPPPPNPEAERRKARAAELAAARTILGFEPDEKLTVEQVKERKRRLAEVYHPDRPTGSVKQMQRVNAAADALLASLATKR